MNSRVLAVALATLAGLGRAAVADGLAQRVASLEHEVAAHAERVQKLEQQSAATSLQIDQILIGLSTQSQQIAGLQASTGALAADVAALGAQGAVLQTKVAGLADQVAQLEQRMAAFAEQLSGISDRLAGFESRLAAAEAGLLALPPPVVSRVDCSAGESVNAKLQALRRGRNTVQVSGACGEVVTVRHLDDVTLIAMSGASVQGFVVDGSRGVTLRNFRVLSTSPPAMAAIRIVRGSVVDVFGNLIDGAVAGISVSGSDALLASNRLTAISQTGISIDARSTVALSGDVVVEGVFPTFAGDSSTGVSLRGASNLVLSATNVASRIRGFSVGMRVADHSNATISVFNDPLGQPRLRVDQHRDSGLVAIASSLTILGSVLVRENPNALSAIDGATTTVSSGAQFVANQSGLTLRNNATARIVANTTFSGNTGAAVSVRAASAISFAGVNIHFAGNGVDVSCDPFSLAGGVGFTNATSVSCANQY